MFSGAMSDALNTCMMLSIDWGEVAQMLTALAAVAALVVGPWMSFSASRRLVVAQSRQQWLDALRADVAEIIALHEDVVSAGAKARMSREQETGTAKEMSRISALRAQIRMRLNMEEEPHRELSAAVNKFISTYDQAHTDYDPNPVINAMDPIAREVWKDVKRARL